MTQLHLTRRSALIGTLALAACDQGAGATSIEPPLSDLRAFSDIERRVGGRLGVTAFDPGRRAWLTHRAGERFAMCSTFKWLLAAQHLAMAQETPGWLGEVMQFGPADLLDHAPFARSVVSRGYMSNEEACEAIVVLSDNTCANLLLQSAGRPAGHTRFLREHGDDVTRLDRTEPALNENLPNDPRDTTAPDAMVRTMQRFLLGDTVLNAASREKLIGWMIACQTGLTRLRGGLPADWRAGDKTGTSADAHNATNDVAIAWPPNRAPILIACYLSDSTVDSAARNAAHAEVARIVAETWS